MWNLGRKKKKPEISEFLFPYEKEFWLMCGEFRDWATDRSKRGYYGLCSCSMESICPPGESSCQEQFYQLVYCMTKDLLQTAPSVVLIEDISNSNAREERKKFLKQLVLSNGGVFLEEHGKLKDSYAFVFSEMPNSFLEEIFWWMAEHRCKEDIYVQYSTLENAAFCGASISEIKQKTVLRQYRTEKIRAGMPEM